MIERIDLRFRSGNSVPIDRAHITAKEWEAFKALYAAVDSYLANPDFENGRSMGVALTALTKEVDQP